MTAVIMDTVATVHQDFVRLNDGISLDEMIEFIQNHVEMTDSGEVTLYPLQWRFETKGGGKDTRQVKTVKAQQQSSMPQKTKLLFTMLQGVFSAISGHSNISFTIIQLINPYLHALLDVLKDEGIINKSDMSYVPVTVLKGLLEKKLSTSGQYNLLEKINTKYPNLRILELATGDYNGNFYTPNFVVTPAVVEDMVDQLTIQQKRDLATMLHQQYC